MTPVAGLKRLRERDNRKFLPARVLLRVSEMTVLHRHNQRLPKTNKVVPDHLALRDGRETQTAGTGPAAICDRFCQTSDQTRRSTSIFLISPIAFAGLRPFGQAWAQFMIVWQR